MSDFLRITSKDNDIIKRVSRLQKSAKKRKEEGVFVLEGLRLCIDAVNNGYTPELALVSISATEKYSTDISKIDKITNIIEITDSLFASISDTVNPQGILCLYKIPSFDYCEINAAGRYLALENVQDPSNLGAISRTAEAFGIDGIFVQDGCDPYSPKSLRASMGALLRIPVYCTDDMFKMFSRAKLKVFASVVNSDANKIGETSFSDGCVVIIGNEANGISGETLKKCENKITIPMRGKAESLNAAAAASIIMWEMCK